MAESSSSTLTPVYAQPAPDVGAAAAPAFAFLDPVRLIVAGAVLLSVIIAIGSSLVLSHTYNQILAESRRELSNIALILAKRLEGMLITAEFVQKRIVEQTAAFTIIDPTERDRQLSKYDLHLKLRDNAAGMPHVGSLTIINAQGRVINFSRQWPIPNIDVSDREFFKALQSDPHLTFFISEPLRNRATGSWVLQFARRISGPNNEFFELITAAIELESLHNIFNQIELVSNRGIGLFRQDGALLARVPQVESQLGRRYENAVSLRLVSNADQGVGIEVGAIQGDLRMIAARRIGSYPIVISVGSPIATILASWYRTAVYIIAISVLTIVLIAALAIIFKQFLRNYQANIKAKAELEERRQLNAAANNMPHGLLMFDAEARLVVYNEQYVKMYGLPPNSVKRGMTFVELIKQRAYYGSFNGDPEKYCSAILGEIGKGVPSSHLIVTPDGRSILVKNSPLPDGGWVTTHEDVSIQRWIEEERNQNRKFISQIIDNMPVAVIVRNASDRRFAYINKAAEALWGIPCTEATGKTAFEVFPRELAQLITVDDDVVLQSDGPIVLDGHPNPGGAADSRILVSRKLAVRAPDGTPQYLISVVEDVTERRNMEAQLRHAQKMEAIGNLTGGMAHDFNNLLMIVIGNLDLLKEMTEGHPELSATIDTILEASLRGAELTRQMLAFARRQPLQPTCVDVNDLIDNTVQLLKRTLDARIRIEAQLSSEVWPISVDKSQLEAAVVNIAINARDAMPDGGTITIVTDKTRIGSDTGAVRLGVTPGEYTTIEIADEGVGMSPEVLARAFEPFFTTKAKDKGTGLGLSIVYGFVKQSGGHVTINSAPGCGTTVKLYLPRYLGADLPAKADPPETTPVCAAAKLILVVDDDDDVRAIAVRHLEALGYFVIEADSAPNAMKKIEAGEKVDLLLTDVIMPGVNGKELARLARVRRPELRVLYTSGFPGVAATEGTDFEACTPLLAKLYSKQELAAAVANALAA